MADAAVWITGSGPDKQLNFRLPTGGKGDKGDKGDKGADGSNVLPTDTAIKDAINNTASATRGALNATFAGKSEAHKSLTTAAPMKAYGAAVASYLAGSLTQIKALTWGDSMAQNMLQGLFPALRRYLDGNLAGVYLAGSSASVTATATTGTVTEATTAYEAWPTGLVTTFTAGSSRTYGVGGTAFICNKIKVFYIKEPGAGTFKVQVDGVDAAGYENVSAAGTLGQLGVITLTPTLGAHTATIVGLTGTVRIPQAGLGFENTAINGVIPINVSKGGLELPDALGAASARSNLQTFVAEVNPTVIFHEMKENASYLAERLTQEFDIFTAAAPRADVVLTATPEVGGTYTDVAAQNVILRERANAYGYIVFDADKAFGTYAEALARGFYNEGDNVHYNAKGLTFLAALMARDLNLFGRFPATSATGKSVAETSIELGGLAGQRSLRLVDVSALDVKAVVQRKLSFLKTDEVEDANSWLIQPNNSTNQQIPNGIRIGSAGPFLQSVLAGERLSVKSARGGGTPKDIEARAVIASGTGAYVGLPAVTTANRPTGIAAGATVLDTTLGKPICYNGTAWIDFTGATV